MSHLPSSGWLQFMKCHAEEVLQYLVCSVLLSEGLIQLLGTKGTCMRCPTSTKLNTLCGTQRHGWGGLPPPPGSLPAMLQWLGRAHVHLARSVIFRRDILGSQSSPGTRVLTSFFCLPCSQGLQGP